MTKDESLKGEVVLHLVTNGQVADLLRLESSRLFRVDLINSIFSSIFFSGAKDNVAHETTVRLSPPRLRVFL